MDAPNKPRLCRSALLQRYQMAVERWRETETRPWERAKCLWFVQVALLAPMASLLTCESVSSGQVAFSRLLLSIGVLVSAASISETRSGNRSNKSAIENRIRIEVQLGLRVTLTDAPFDSSTSAIADTTSNLFAMESALFALYALLLILAGSILG